MRRVAMVDADVSILHDLDLPLPRAEVLRRLIDETPWQQRAIKMFGRTVPQPRLTAWYGDPGRTYRYSGIANEPLPWTDLLRALKATAEACTGSAFNGVLLNWYRDGDDAMGFHSDDEKELGPDPTIASLSFGDTRDCVFRHRHRADLSVVSVPLPDASVLVMRGATQRCWKHAIKRDRRPRGARVNLTFRQLYTPTELRR